MTSCASCILLLAVSIINTCNSTSRRIVNGSENSEQCRMGNALKIYDNRKIHRNETELVKRLEKSNSAEHKSFIFSSEAEEFSKARKSKRDVYSNRKPDEKKRGVTHQERIDLLVAHNHWRRVVGNSQASNIIHMVWSVELEKIALYWALNCRYDEGLPDSIPDKYRHPGVGIGQNIWARIGSYNVKSAVEDFYNEKMNYNSTNQSPCDQSNRCKRYRQVVWAESIYLGCAIVFCSTYLASSRIDKDVFNLVCNYSPEGNRLSVGGIPIQPYRVGPTGTQCPLPHLQVENGLCRTNPPCKDVTDCNSPSNTTTCLCDPSYYEKSEDISRSKTRPKDLETSATFLKSLSCSSRKLTASSTNLSFTAFVALMVTSAVSFESAF